MSAKEPFNAIENMLAFNSRDWAANKTDAWLWGIVFGWDADDDEPEEGGAMEDLARRHGWYPGQVAKLRALHEAWEEAKKGTTE